MADEKFFPPKVDKTTGAAMIGDYPLNHRRRAEALAAAGIETDPEGLVTPELIADAGDRVARLEKASAAEEKRLAAEKAAADKEAAAVEKEAAKQAEADAKAIAAAEADNATEAAAPGAADKGE